MSLLVLLFNSNDFWRKNNLNHLKRSNNSGRKRAIDELVDSWRFHDTIYIFIQITVAKYSLWPSLGLPRLRLQSGFQECCDHSTQCIIHTYHIDSHCIDHTKVTSILHIHKCTILCSLKICCHSLCCLNFTTSNDPILIKSAPVLKWKVATPALDASMKCFCGSQGVSTHHWKQKLYSGLYIYISNPTKTALLYSSFMMLNVYTNYLTTTIDLQIVDTVNLGSLMTPVVGSRITRSVISEFPTSRHLTLLNAKKPPDAPKKQHAQTVTGFIPNILQPLKLNWQHEKPQRNDFPNIPNSVLIPCGWTQNLGWILCVLMFYTKNQHKVVFTK